MTDSMDSLNSSCFCVSLDEAKLDDALSTAIGDAAFAAGVRERCPHAFSARPVFVSADRMARMERLVAAIESVIALPAYRELVLSRAPGIASHAPGARGAFFGYDFHVADDRLGLIEINTNAGGAMLNAVLARAHRACCTPAERLGPTVASGESFEDA